MFLIALTGGIAAGKSTVAKMLVALGAEEIDSDVIAREVVAPGSVGLEELVSLFGTDILLPDGTLNRKHLAEFIFSDPEKRTQVESILHPLIRERTQELISKSKSEIVIYTVPLLVESGVDHGFDFVITVEAPIEQRIERLVQARGLSESEARARILAQATEQERRSRADWVIDSSGSKEELTKQVSQVWERIRQLSRGRNGSGN